MGSLFIGHVEGSGCLKIQGGESCFERPDSRCKLDRGWVDYFYFDVYRGRVYRGRSNISPGSESAADEMVECLRTRILPFLDRMRSLEAMRDWLASMNMPMPKHPYPPPVIYFAVLQSQLGDMKGACNALIELEGKALGAWKAGTREVALRIGCGDLSGGVATFP